MLIYVLDQTTREYGNISLNSTLPYLYIDLVLSYCRVLNNSKKSIITKIGWDIKCLLYFKNYN